MRRSKKRSSCCLLVLEEHWSSWKEFGTPSNTVIMSWNICIGVKLCTECRVSLLPICTGIIVCDVDNWEAAGRNGRRLAASLPEIFLIIVLKNLPTMFTGRPTAMSWSDLSCTNSCNQLLAEKRTQWPLKLEYTNRHYSGKLVDGSTIWLE